MRDLDRWKDKVELSLDGRQIFFIFFGSSIIACMIFVFGIMLGKRLEARALALSPPSAEDPLAALDQLSDADDGLTFHQALTKDTHRGAIVPTANGEKKRSVAETSAASESAPVAKSSDSALPRPPILPSLPMQPVALAKPKVETGHFTLQLSAFPDRSDADEFMRRVQAAGYHPFVVQSEVPGRGTFYRVRLGDFTSRQAAADFKTEFEKKQRLMAYVAKI